MEILLQVSLGTKLVWPLELIEALWFHKVAVVHGFYNKLAKDGYIYSLPILGLLVLWFGFKLHVFLVELLEVNQRRQKSNGKKLRPFKIINSSLIRI